jgi:hypothetical protein
MPTRWPVCGSHLVGFCIGGVIALRAATKRPAFEAVCDLLAERLRGERAVFGGYFHMPQHAGGPFNDRVERLWASASTPAVT